MKKQTAVEWLIEHISYDNDYGQRWVSFKEATDLNIYFQKALEMEKEQIVKNITDYNVKVTEFLLTPLFNLEHSKHGISCEKLAIIRNQFINEL